MRPDAKLHLPRLLTKFSSVVTPQRTMIDLFVDLAIPGGVDKLFTYSVPMELQHAVRRGIRVVAPFGKRTVIGFVIDTSLTSQACADRARTVPHIKPIRDLLDAEPILTDDILELTRWISEYYFAPWGEVLKAVLVQGSARPANRVVSFSASDLTAALLQLRQAPRQSGLLRHVAQSGPLTIQQLQKLTRSKSLYASLNDLVKRGFVRISEDELKEPATTKTEQIIEIDYESRRQWEERLNNPSYAVDRAPGQAAILRYLTGVVELPSVQTVTDLLRNSGGTISSFKALVRKGILTPATRDRTRTAEYELYPSALGSIEITLNEAQQQSFAAIQEALDGGSFRTFLLHGVTASGKTQIYIEAIRAVLEQGRTAIVLVPEISLTPQIVRRFKYHFKEEVAVIHSRMSIGERYDAWRAAWGGRCSVVIGPRSAVFAPLKRLGLIVVDEEHESSYKQFDQTPRYHARDVAIVRASAAGAVALLGSATPSLESYTNALAGKYTLLNLPERIDTAQLPPVEIVDMTVERKKRLEELRAARKERRKSGGSGTEEDRMPGSTAISALLREKVAERLAKHEGIILLQNRRGFASYVECPDCGYTEVCERCSISLTFHAAARHLRCHYCGFTKAAPAICPRCHSSGIRYLGVGTQRVEKELADLFPAARVLRMDLDTTSRKGSHDALLRAFSEGEADILLGTQMVAKGLDFSRVTLVGVISADTQMLLPDFRSSERTFQLLTQVAGRAGRSALQGEVVIQTAQPGHPSLRHVLTHDFVGFYNEEIAIRKELTYPPFSRLVLLEFRGKVESDVEQHASGFARLLAGYSSSFAVLGPAAAALSRIKNLYRWHIILKSAKETDPGGNRLRRVLHEAVHAYRSSPHGKGRAVTMTIDIDPISMM